MFQVALPWIVVDVDKDGNPSVMGLGPAVLKGMGVDLAGMQVPVSTIEQMAKANVQHIEIASVGDRLVFLVNGKPMPHLGWNANSLQQGLNLMDVLGVQNAGLYKKLLPLVTRLGLNIILRFPTSCPPGAAVIPLSEPGTAKKTTITPTTEAPSLITKFEIKFDENGVPSIMGLSGNDLAALGMGAMGGLSPDMLVKLQAGNIQSMELRVKPDGLHMYVNGESLPLVIWDSALLKNVVEVYGQLSPDASLLPVIQAFLPFLDRQTWESCCTSHRPPARMSSRRKCTNNRRCCRHSTYHTLNGGSNAEDCIRPADHHRFASCRLWSRRHATERADPIRRAVRRGAAATYH